MIQYEIQLIKYTADTFTPRLITLKMEDTEAK